MDVYVNLSVFLAFVQALNPCSRHWPVVCPVNNAVACDEIISGVQAAKRAYIIEFHQMLRNHASGILPVNSKACYAFVLCHESYKKNENKQYRCRNGSPETPPSALNQASHIRISYYSII